MSDDTKTKEQREPSGEPGPSSRRAFLRLGALTGAAGLLGLPAIALGGDDHELADEEAGQAEEVVRLLNQDGQLVEVKKSALKTHAHHGKVVSDAQKVRKGVAGRSFVMVIDLASCRNARKCVEACQASHGLRIDQEYVRVKRMKDDEHTAPYWMPQLCFHCDNPPCTKVCPVDATFKRDDGIVAINSDQCIGCRFCMAACPYNARVFNWNQPGDVDYQADYSPETSLPKQRGTVDKCDFCADMAREGKLPHCVSSCPNGVYYFGDRDEDVVTNGSETVRFSKLIEERGGYQYMDELGTSPRVYYLPPRNREFPFETGEEEYEEAKEAVENYRLDREPSHD